MINAQEKNKTDSYSDSDLIKSFLFSTLTNEQFCEWKYGQTDDISR